MLSVNSQEETDWRTTLLGSAEGTDVKRAIKEEICDTYRQTNKDKNCKDINIAQNDGDGRSCDVCTDCCDMEVVFQDT